VLHGEFAARQWDSSLSLWWALDFMSKTWENTARAEYMSPKAHQKEKARLFQSKELLSNVRSGWATVACPKGQVLFAQGDPANSVFHIDKGKVKLTVVSSHGKEAVIALLSGGDFVGEGCLAGQVRRMATATAMTDCVTVRLEKPEMVRVLRDEPGFSERFLHYVLSRNIRIEEDLVDHLFNSSEKRLARVLLLLANFGKDGKTEPVIAKMSQEMLAEIIGTTRPRVNFFMNKFRKLGFIDYDGGGLRVHSSLLHVVLHD
jgi:CRP/FNR family transcriptional regulator, cyclic AMP receptor protein